MPLERRKALTELKGLSLVLPVGSIYLHYGGVGALVDYPLATCLHGIDESRLALYVTAEGACADAGPHEEDILAEALRHQFGRGVKVDAVKLHLHLLFTIKVDALAVVHVDTEANPFVLPHCPVSVDSIIHRQGGHIALKLHRIDFGVSVLSVPQLHVGIYLSSCLPNVPLQGKQECTS